MPERPVGGKQERIHKRRFRRSVLIQFALPPDLGDASILLAAAADAGEALGAVGLFEEVLFGEILAGFEQELLLRGGGVGAQELPGIRGVVQEELLACGGGGMGGGKVMLLRGGIALVELVVLRGGGGLMEESSLVVAARGLRRLGGFGRLRRGGNREGARDEAEHESRAEEPAGKRMFHTRETRA